MYRRDALRTVAAFSTLSLAGCWGSAVSGAVADNETPLTIDHEYTIRSSGYGTTVVVDVTATNEREASIDGPKPVLDATCRFLDGDGQRLHGSTRRIEPPLGPGWQRSMQFKLGGSATDADRYELLFRWDDTE